MKKFGVSCLFVLVGCFDAGTAPLICSIEAPACPDGYVCSNAQCVTLSDMSSEQDAAADGMPTQMDLAGSQCTKGNGALIGVSGAWLCPGAFGGTNSKASTLCRGRVCLDASLFTRQECVAVAGGFFAANVWGSTLDKINPQISECNSKGYNVSSFGCGTGTDYQVTTGCSGFVTFIQHSVPNKLYGPSPFDIDLLTNTNPLNGVICCP